MSFVACAAKRKVFIIHAFDDINECQRPIYYLFWFLQYILADVLTIPAVPRFSARGQDVPLKSETSGRSQYWLFTSFVAVLRKYGFLQHMPLITSMNISTGRTKIDMPYIYIYWFFWLCIGHEMREEWHTIYIGFYRISCTRAAKIPMQSIFRAWYWSFAAGITQKVKGMSEKSI